MNTIAVLFHDILFSTNTKHFLGKIYLWKNHQNETVVFYPLFLYFHKLAELSKKHPQIYTRGSCGWMYRES